MIDYSLIISECTHQKSSSCSFSTISSSYSSSISGMNWSYSYILSSAYSSSLPTSLLKAFGLQLQMSLYTPVFSRYISSSSIFCSMLAAIKALAYRTLSLLSAFFFIGTISSLPCSFSFLICMIICLSLVSLCLHLWMMKGDQQMRCSSISSRAFWQDLLSLTFSQSWSGRCALSAVFMQRQQTPFYYLTVAYWELARGHDLRLHKPVRLYQFLQKFWDSVLGQTYSLLHTKRAVLVLDDVPNYLVDNHLFISTIQYYKQFQPRKQITDYIIWPTGRDDCLSGEEFEGLVKDYQFKNRLQSMLGMLRAQDLQISGPLPVLLKNPSFADKRHLWVKETTHPKIGASSITSQRYEFIKIGKTFGFQTTRYLAIYQDHLFYYDAQSDKQFKGYCQMENVYVQWFSLKNGRYLLFLTNGEESSFFFFEQAAFWKETRSILSKYMIQVNFAERYELIEPIGKGSFSKVQKVKCNATGKYYAAKIISKKDKNNAPTKSLVLQERKILRLIKSQYVYSFEQLYQEDAHYIFITEYLPGKDLMALWKQKKLNEPSIVIPLLRMILEGIRDIHNAKVIHRDLKPQNILINLATFKPSIIDFGLSLLLDETVSSKSYKRCGTMGYMAPEVIQNSGEQKKPYTNKCDLFSYGIICHMLLLGFNPVKGENYDETYTKNRACEIVINKTAANAKWGEFCYIFLTKLLSKYPQFRFDAEQALKCEFFLQKPIVSHPDKEQSSSTMQDKRAYISVGKK